MGFLGKLRIACQSKDSRAASGHRNDFETIEAKRVDNFGDIRQEEGTGRLEIVSDGVGQRFFVAGSQGLDDSLGVDLKVLRLSFVVRFENLLGRKAFDRLHEKAEERLCHWDRLEFFADARHDRRVHFQEERDVGSNLESDFVQHLIVGFELKDVDDSLHYRCRIARTAAKTGREGDFLMDIDDEVVLEAESLAQLANGLRAKIVAGEVEACVVAGDEGVDGIRGFAHLDNVVKFEGQIHHFEIVETISQRAEDPQRQIDFRMGANNEAVSMEQHMWAREY